MATVSVASEHAFPVYRFTVDQYHRMIEAGVLDEGDAVELLEGVVAHKGRWRDGGVVPYHFTVDQYHQMIAAGILTEDDGVELIEGEIVPKMARNPPHDSTLDKLEDQKAITLATGEPEPDVAVVLNPAGRYDDHHPNPGEIAMVAEVADRSITIDQSIKLRAYARAKLPIYWIVNLVDRRVEVYTQPRGGKNPTYRSRTDYAPGESVPVIIAGTPVGSVPVDAILPRNR
jgi:hypothetical protein